MRRARWHLSRSLQNP